MTTEIMALVEQAHVRLWNRGTLHSAPANGCPKRQAQSTCRGMEVQSRVAHRQTVPNLDIPNMHLNLFDLFNLFVVLIYVLNCIDGTLFCFQRDLHD